MKIRADLYEKDETPNGRTWRQLLRDIPTPPPAAAIEQIAQRLRKASTPQPRSLSIVERAARAVATNTPTAIPGVRKLAQRLRHAGYASDARLLDAYRAWAYAALAIEQRIIRHADLVADLAWELVERIESGRSLTHYLPTLHPRLLRRALADWIRTIVPLRSDWLDDPEMLADAQKSLERVTEAMGWQRFWSPVPPTHTLTPMHAKEFLRYPWAYTEVALATFHRTLASAGTTASQRTKRMVVDTLPA